MADNLDKLSDKELEKLERKLHELYKEATEEMSETIKEYFLYFERRDAQMKKLIGSTQNGREWTENDYKQWRLAQIGRGKRFEDLRDKLAERMTKANEMASAYVNDVTPGVYSLNMNYTAYQIEQIYGNIGFTVWDDETIRRLVLEDPALMPYYPEKLAVKWGIDLAYGAQQITAQVTSSILLGDSVYEIADKLQSRIEDMNRTSAVRAARTAFTAAQNGGRQASYERAAQMGIKVRKRWIATKDLRTRHEHGAADEQTVPYDEPFNVGGEKLMFPGDRTAASGWNIYNCRCTTRTVEKEGIEAEPRMMRVRDPVTGRNKLVQEMTYKEWYDYHSKVDPQGFEKAKKMAKNRSSDFSLYTKHKNEFGSKAPQLFAEFINLKYNSGEWGMYKDYTAAMRSGELTSLATFNLYKKTSAQIDEKLVGITTSNGITVSGKSKHFISRTIGSVKQRRSGVELDDVLKALTDPRAQVLPIRTNKAGERSQIFRYAGLDVSVNPDTGVLIQTNPQRKAK